MSVEKGYGMAVQAGYLPENGTHYLLRLVRQQRTLGLFVQGLLNDPSGEWPDSDPERFDWSRAEVRARLGGDMLPLHPQVPDMWY